MVLQDKSSKLKAKLLTLGTISSNNSGGIAYISIVDLVDKVPVDLEDWSAEKGLYIPSIVRCNPFRWSGMSDLSKLVPYTVDILDNGDSDLGFPPVASSKIFMDVQPKFNLNPRKHSAGGFRSPCWIISCPGFY